MANKQKEIKAWATIWEDIKLEDQESFDVFIKRRWAKSSMLYLSQKYHTRIKVVPCKITFLK